MASDHSTIALPPREWLSPAEVANLIGRAPFTVRQWCRMGRVEARKRACGRGRHLAWEIHADELARYLNHGLRSTGSGNQPQQPGDSQC